MSSVSKRLAPLLMAACVVFAEANTADAWTAKRQALAYYYSWFSINYQSQQKFPTSITGSHWNSCNLTLVSAMCNADAPVSTELWRSVLLPAGDPGSGTELRRAV